MVKDDFGSNTPKGPIDPRLLERQRMRRERLGSRKPLHPDAIKEAVRRAGAPPLATGQAAVGEAQDFRKDRTSYPLPLSRPEQEDTIRVFKEREGIVFGFTARAVLNSFTDAPNAQTISLWSPLPFTDGQDTLKDGEQLYVKREGYHGVRLKMEGERIDDGKISIRVYLYPLFTFVDEMGRPWLHDNAGGPELADDIYVKAWNNIPKLTGNQGIYCGTIVYKADSTLFRGQE